MKKSTLITAVLLSLKCISQAQSSDDTDNREKFQVGLKAGLNFSNVYDEKTSDFKADGKFGFTGGTFMAIPFGKYFGLQPEVLISQKGFKATGMSIGSPYTFTRTTTYLDIPLFFALKPSEFFTILVGPEYSYLLKQHDAFTSSSTSYYQEQEFSHDNIRKNTFGFVAGLDINLKHIVLGTRIGWDVMNNNGDGTSTTPRYKNVWFQGCVGYKIYK